ncbi:MAG: hypothetical protein ACYDDO_15415 [Acidiferrobacterales bacterium]
MRHKHFIHLGWALLMFLVLTACGSSSGGGTTPAPSSSSNSTPNSVTITGMLSSNYTLASNPNWVDRVLALIGPPTASAGAVTINNVVAISPGGTVVLASKSGNTFTLTLPENDTYLVVLLNGPTIEGIYYAGGSATGMHSFPISTGASAIDLGTVSIDINGVATGTISSTTLGQDLGMTQGMMTTFGIMDVGMERLSSVDVDGDGTIDYLEGRAFDLRLDYEFAPGGTLANIENAWSSHNTASYKGYEYYFSAQPDNTGLNWATAMLNPPSSSALPPAQECYNVTGPATGPTATPGEIERTLNFYCGGSATSPVTPPTGTYTVTVPVTAGGTQTYTFQNMASQTIDSTNLYNIYVPEVYLTYSGGQITKIQWAWWKNDPILGWVQPSNAELSTVLSDAEFEIGDSSWGASRVQASIALTTTGSVVPANQGFTPGHFRISFSDKAGYDYGFEW